MSKLFSLTVIATFILSVARAATPYQDNLNLEPDRGLHSPASVTLYGNYFVYGSGPIDPRFYEAQIAASDINGDGIPLSVADYVCLFREQIRRDIALAEVQITSRPAHVRGFFGLSARTSGPYAAVRARTIDALGGAQLVFRYKDTEIDSVVPVGHASKMGIRYVSEKGVLRILLTAPEPPDPAAPMSGEIIRIMPRSRNGTLELVSVDAATYDCKIIKPEFGSRKLNLRTLREE